MSDIAIPIALAGPGTQPVEVDGAELDILQMPSGMQTYAAPSLPEPEQVQGLGPALALLRRLQAHMQRHRVDQPPVQIDLVGLDAANRNLLDQVLGEGEVSVVISGSVQVRIQESVLAGLWRVRGYAPGGALISDSVEVGAIPRLVTTATFEDAADRVEMPPQGVAEDVRNAPPVLAEINGKVAASSAEAEPHVINLTLLPQTEQDLAFLDERLGQGCVSILSRGYGNCRINSTATRHVWWVRYFNSQDRNILNSLEITSVPKVACAAQEDIQDSAERLREILDIYR
jgi:hydrogenase-1 operon protein HyaF